MPGPIGQYMILKPDNADVGLEISACDGQRPDVGDRE